MFSIDKRFTWRALIPANCPGCAIRTPNQDLCPKCTLALLGQEQKPRCPTCRLILIAGLCLNCSRHTIYYDHVISAFDYKGLGQQLVHDYKIHKRLSLVGLLADLLLQAIVQADLPVWPDIIVPVPAHFSSIQARGFSPPAEIGRLIAKRLKLDYQLNLLRRTTETARQSGLNFQQRLQMPLSTYACSQNITGKTVAVIDDVMTTGTTLNVAAKILKQSGAKTVHGWVLARTLR